MVKSNLSYLWFSISFTLPYTSYHCLHSEHGIPKAKNQLHNYWCRLYFINERKTHRSRQARGTSQPHRAKSSWGRGRAETDKDSSKLMNSSHFSDRRDPKAAKHSDSWETLIRTNKTSTATGKPFSILRIWKLVGSIPRIPKQCHRQQRAQKRSRKRAL